MTQEQIELCNECGRSVKFGSGLFINRVPDFNDYEYRKKEMNKPFPKEILYARIVMKNFQIN